MFLDKPVKTKTLTGENKKELLSSTNVSLFLCFSIIQLLTGSFVNGLIAGKGQIIMQMSVWKVMCNLLWCRKQNITRPVTIITLSTYRKLCVFSLQKNFTNMMPE